MASTYYVIGLMLLAAVVAGQDIGKFSQQDNGIMGPLVSSMIGNPYVCEVCEELVGFLKNVTEEKTTLDELVKLLLPLCDWAPYVQHQDCLNFIDAIPAMVKEYADKYLDPVKDCKFLCAPRMTSESRDRAAPLANILTQMMAKANKAVNREK